MKKFYLVLFGAMLTVTAFAQQGKNGLVLDSTYVTSGNGERQSKSIIEYNANKQMTAQYDYSYFDDNFTFVNPPILEEKMVVDYDAQGQMAKVSGYAYDNGEEYLYFTQEYSDYDKATDIPKTILLKYLIDDENSSVGLEYYLKVVVNKIGTNGVEDETTSVYYMGQWIEYYSAHYDYNADGTLAKETDLGYVTDVTTYEYDENKEVSKKTVVSADQLGRPVTTVTTYAYEYYSDGNMKKMTATKNNNSSMEYYFWGDGKAKGGDAAGIELARKQMEKVQRIYDLNGRSVQNPKKGLYIMNGKKVFIK